MMLIALRHCSAVKDGRGFACCCATAGEFAPPNIAAAVTPDSAERNALRVKEDDGGIVSSTKNLKGALRDYLCYS
jgi:hypothetical protein